MGAKTPLPAELGNTFRVGEARARGAGRGRLRGPDLVRPFHGIRSRDEPATEAPDPWQRRRADLIWRAEAYKPMLRPGQFFSHESAIALFGGPLQRTSDTLLDVSVTGAGSFPRAAGVRGHRAQAVATAVRKVRGLPTSSPATTWAMMGAALSRDELVVLGDYLCRVWRKGLGRPSAGRQPLATPEQLTAAARAGRRRGATRLRDALPLIRLDSWSPRETRTRLAIISEGLPEPQLNLDIYDEHEFFLGCVDLCYPEFKVAIEYQGQHHGARYARDVERIERLRAAGWIVIQATSELLRYPNVLARRIRDALRSRGWRG